MANQNFKVKKGLEVGTALTATSHGLNVTGVVTATQFSGDGSGLTGVTAAGSGVVVQEEGSNVGTAATINFIGSNVTAAISGGVASVTITGGSSDVVSDTTPQLGGNLDLNSKDITGTGNISITGGFNATGVSTFQNSVTFQSHASFGDNDKANFGAGNDIQIYHNGTNSFIDNTTGSLYIRGANGNHVRIQSPSGEESIVAAANGSVDLYYDNSKRFETTNAGVSVTGVIQLTSHLYMPDSAEIKLGTGDEFKIYHDGTDSYVDNQTGDLILRTSSVGDDVFVRAMDDVFIQPGNGANGVTVKGSGAVELYHNNSKKFETKSDGIDVTGEVQCDSLDVDGNADISGTVSFGSTVTFGSDDEILLGNSQELSLKYSSSSSGAIISAGGNPIDIKGTAIRLKSNLDENIIIGTTNDSVSLYYDNSKKLETSNTGATVTGTLAATAVTGDGSGLTSLTGASAGTFGASNATPIITVDSNGRITGIATVATAGAGGGGGISNIVEDTTPQLGGDLDMNGNNITSNVDIVSTDSGSAAAPELSLYRNSPSPAASDYIGQIKFHGESSTGVKRLYAKITGKIGDHTNGAEDGIIEIAHRKNGANNISARWNQDELQFLNGTNVSWADNLKAKFGASDDLQIYHDGTNSYVSDAGTGGLKITGGDVYIRNTSDQDMIHASSGSFVKLYHNNALRLQTTGTGVNITDNLNVAGVSTFQGNVNLGDSDEIRFGAGSGSGDFKIYHDHSNFHDVIYEGISGAEAIFQSNIGGASNNSFEFKRNSNTLAMMRETEVVLYSGGSAKFQTSATGATVTGALTATTIVKSGGTSSQYLMADGSVSTTVGISTNSSNIQATWSVTANGSSAYRFTGPGNDGADDNPDLYLVRGQRYRFTNNSGGSHPFQIRSVVGGSAYSAGVTNNGASSGNIEFNVQHDAPSRLFYQCTSHSGMVGNIYITGGGQWQNTSVAASGTPEIYTDYAVGIGTDNPGNDLEIASSGNGKGLLVTKNGVNSTFLGHNGSGNEGLLILRENGTNKIQLYAESNQTSFINTGGNLGIGTASPHAKLEVSGGQNQTANQFTDLVSIAANANNDSINAEVQLNFGISPSHTAEANRKARIQSVTHGGTATPLLINPAGGQIGMGIASPTQESGIGLHIRGADGGQSRIHLTNSYTGDTATDGFYVISQGAESGGAAGEVMLQQKENKALKFATNNTERLRIAGDGQATFDKGAPGGANQVIARFQAESSRRLDIVWHDSGSLLGFDLPGSHSYTFKCAGSEKVRITSAGDVGIGEDSPGNRLVVQKTNAAGDVAARIKNDTTTDGTAANPTTASLYLTTSTGDFNTFYIQARRSDNDTHFGYADPRSNGHTPNMIISNDGLITTPNRPRFIAKLSGNATYNPSNFGNYIDFNSEEYDIGGNFTTSGTDQGLFTAPVAGLYQFNAAAYGASVAWTQSWFVVNGSRKSYTDWVNNISGDFIQNSQAIYLNSGDKVGFHPHRGGSSSYTIYANVHHTYFSGYLIG